MAKAETGNRRQAERRGRRAEWLAALALVVKGYRPIARRAKTPLGEIDLLVARGRVLAAVEVKARSDVMSGLDAVSVRAQQRMARALDWWLVRNPRFAAHDLRFDLVVVAPRRWPRHLPGAFEPHFS